MTRYVDAAGGFLDTDEWAVPLDRKVVHHVAVQGVRERAHEVLEDRVVQGVQKEEVQGVRKEEDRGVQEEEDRGI